MGDYRTTVGEPPPLTQRERRRQRLKLVSIVAGVAVFLLALGLLIRVNRYVVATGYVTTEDYAEVRPATQGAVVGILVDSGGDVAAGDLLVQLDDSQEQALRDEAASRVRKMEAEFAKRKAEADEEKRQRDNQVSRAGLRLQHAASKLELARELNAKGLASGRALEDAELNEKLVRSELEALVNRDETLPQKELEVLREEVAACRDAFARADARVMARQIRAPLSGKVVRYGFVVGELVRPDTVLYEVFGGEKQILRLRVPERFATRVAPGQHYRAELLPYSGLIGVRFKGRIESLRDVIETENQKTYRVADCSFDARKYTVPPGTTAEARIRVGRSPLLISLFGIY